MKAKVKSAVKKPIPSKTLSRKKSILVQFRGMDDRLDTKIEHLAKKNRLVWDGTGYALHKMGDTPANTREHFIYGVNKANIAKFQQDVVKLKRGIKVTVRKSL
jgi:hypothetical protein